MDHKDLEEINGLANLLSAISTPLRIQIIYILAEERTASIPTLQGHLKHVSNFVLYQNLAHLYKTGLLKKHRKGRDIFYTLKDLTIKERLDALSSSGLSLKLS